MRAYHCLVLCLLLQMSGLFRAYGYLRGRLRILRTIPGREFDEPKELVVSSIRFLVCLCVERRGERSHAVDTRG